MARLVGVRVHTFSIGFGPKLLKRRWGDTEYALSLIPFGGYVHMAGEVWEEGYTPRPGDFLSKSIPARTLVVLGGPLANLLLGLMLYTTAYGIVGIEEFPGNTVAEVVEGKGAAKFGLQPGDQILKVDGVSFWGWSLITDLLIHEASPDDSLTITVLRGNDTLVLHGKIGWLSDPGLTPLVPPVISRVLPHSAAERAGLQPGDSVVAINNLPVRHWHELARRIRDSGGSSLTLTFVRKGIRHTLTVTPELDTLRQGDSTVVRPLLGILAPTVRRHLPLDHALRLAWLRSVRVVQQVGEMLKRIFSGHASMKEVGGPVMIGKVMGQSAQVGWFPFLTLLALVSINLGLLNLLPFPVLDGGHLAFLLVEAIRRRPVPLRVQAAVQQLGFVLLILLMVYITFQDILKLKGSG